MDSPDISSNNENNKLVTITHIVLPASQEDDGDDHDADQDGPGHAQQEQ